VSQQRHALSPILRAATGILVLVVRLYQLILSPFLGGRCRYEPSCSHYAIEALRIHGPLKGSALAGKRIARCHPWGGFGYDPVPAPQKDKP
jgi:putative membrane protein insertion efficiency factor